MRAVAEEIGADRTAIIRRTWPTALMVLRLGRTRETLDQDILSG